MPEIRIDELDWDDDNEEHMLVDHHIDPEWVHVMIESRDWVCARNKRDQPQERLLVIGKTPGGMRLTVVLAPTAVPGRWHPVTAYPSSQAEIRHYDRRQPSARR